MVLIALKPLTLTLTSHGQDPENHSVYVEQERPGLLMQELDYFQQPSFPHIQADAYYQETVFPSITLIYHL